MITKKTDLLQLVRRHPSHLWGPRSCSCSSLVVSWCPPSLWCMWPHWGRWQRCGKPGGADASSRRTAPTSGCTALGCTRSDVDQRSGRSRWRRGWYRWAESWLSRLQSGKSLSEFWNFSLLCFSQVLSPAQWVIVEDNFANKTKINCLFDCCKHSIRRCSHKIRPACFFPAGCAICILSTFICRPLIPAFL